MTPLRVGVIGAGRVGAVLAAVLRSRGHEIVSVAGESDASLRRAARPAARRPRRQADRGRPVLRRAPADGPRRHARERRHPAGRERRPPRRPVRRTHQRQPRAPGPRARAPVGAHPVAMHPAMTFTGTARDLDRLPDCVFGVTAGPAERDWARAAGGRARRRRDVGARGAAQRSTTPASPTAPTTWSPWSPRRWSCSSAAGADDPAAILRPLLDAALDNALTDGDAALTGPIVRGDVNTVRAHLAEISATAPDTLPSYVALARATLDRVVTDGRVLPIRAAAIRRVLDVAGPAPTFRSRRRVDAAAMTRPLSSRPRARSSTRTSRRVAGRAPPVVLVPTMGALHDGHAALLRAARERAGPGVVVASIFVNPLQFAPGEDLDRYPRTLDADLDLCAAAGVDVVFAPGGGRDVPRRRAAGHRRARAARRRVLEGASRPGHFRGVLTVVAKLFGLIRPDRRGVRGEGLPAAGPGPADEPRPVPRRRGGRRRPPCARPTASPCRAATATSTPSSVATRPRCPGPCGRRRSTRRAAPAAARGGRDRGARRGAGGRASTTSRSGRPSSPRSTAAVRARGGSWWRPGSARTRLIDNLPLVLGPRG